VLKGGMGFDKAVHDQLLTLHDKLIAHSDSDYADGRLFDKSMVITRGQGELKVLTGVRVMTLTVHLLHDMGLAARILAHVQAAEKAAYARLEQHVEEFTKAAQQSPEVYEEARARHLPPIYAGRIELSPENPRASLSIPDLDPHRVLSPPPLPGR
jgi:hypothetical protein